MAVLVTQELPGVSQKLYDGVNEKINAVAGPPAGLIVHTSGPADGGWRIVDVWESEAQAREFYEGRLTKAIEAVIGMAPPATTAAEPPDEPPGVRSRFHGLRVTLSTPR